MSRRLHVVLIKPSKYDLDGCVQRYRWGFMPNSTLLYIAGLTPAQLGDAEIRVTTIDEYVHPNASYLKLLNPSRDEAVLLACVGTQTHQFQRASDLAALAVRNGCLAVIGGPHPMTCDTAHLQNRGVSFCQSEAEAGNAWLQILSDAIRGELAPVYGQHQRWADKLNPPPLNPVSRDEQRRYLGRMQGIYPARGCPKTCNFCSVIKTAGRNVRSQPVETTIESLLRAHSEGVELFMFTSDNFNKYYDVEKLLEAMIATRIRLRFMCQCDTDILEQPKLVDLMGRAGCFQVFLGVESFDLRTLQLAHKGHNKPKRYGEIVELLGQHGIMAHFSNILGFELDTPQSIEHHLGELLKLRPALASFYLLTHIPGTERYADVMRQGRVITETNLDRFDGTRPTWDHQHLTPKQWLAAFKMCYRKFYSARQVISTVAYMRRLHPNLARRVPAAIGFAAFARLMAFRGEHPMSGGISRIRADHVSEYLPLRRSFYGLGDLFPLPSNLELSGADLAINAQADDKAWRKRA